MEATYQINNLKFSYNIKYILSFERRTSDICFQIVGNSKVGSKFYNLLKFCICKYTTI